MNPEVVIAKIRKLLNGIPDEKCDCLPCCSHCHCNCHSCLVDGLCCGHKTKPSKNPPKFHVGQRVRTRFGNTYNTYIDHCGTVLRVSPKDHSYYYCVKMCPNDEGIGVRKGERTHGESLFEAVVCQCTCCGHHCHCCHCNCK